MSDKVIDKIISINGAAAPSLAAATPVKTCNGINNKKWIALDNPNDKMDTYCADAAKQGVQDKESGSLVRTYNAGTPDELTLSMDWPPGLSFKLLESDCKNYMSSVMDSK